VMEMSKVQSWEVSDEFWARVEPLILMRQRCTDKEYKRKPSAGRPLEDA
jgi:putative transposase